MIVNNKHVTGIFLYSEDLPYTLGDFVVYNECIYYCSAKKPTDTKNNSVTGKNPEEDTENFELYLSHRLADFEYFEDFVDNPSGKEDKAISCETLSKVLLNYYVGLDDKGVITETIEFDSSDQSINLTDRLESLIGSGFDKSNILNKILMNSGLNNASFRLSRDLPEIEAIFPEVPGTLNSKYVILRQYSYYDSKDRLMRVQEISDYVNALQIFRHSVTPFSSISQWRRSTVNDNFIKELDYIKNHYTNLINSLEVEKRSLRGFFNQYNVKITESNLVSLQCSNKTSPGFIQSSGRDFRETSVIDVLINFDNQDRTYSSHSLVINLADSYGDSPITSYKIPGGKVKLVISPKSPTELTIEVQGLNGKISSIIGRNYVK